MKPHNIPADKVKILKSLPTPAFVIDEQRLTENLRLLQSIEQRSGAHILLAQKCFSTFCMYPLIASHISGCVASGIYEARLGHEEFRKQNHVYAPAYKDEDIPELDDICDHIVFNSWSQYRRHQHKCTKASLGIRVNPECSTQPPEHAIYDPCTTGSRLGIRIDDMPEILPENIEGFHCHTLCEQGYDDLETTFRALEKSFGKYFHRLKWLNLGGGHYISHQDYDVERLVQLIGEIRQKYNVDVYLEPGEGVVLNAGYLVTEVMDKVSNGMEILILDCSAACHCPDVIEGPYLPPIWDAHNDGKGKLKYRLGSMTCLAGDVMGDYGFDHEIAIGDKLIIEDMALYTMVKTNTFNGMPLPDIQLIRADGSTQLIKRFGYQDFKQRLG